MKTLRCMAFFALSALLLFNAQSAPAREFTVRSSANLSGSPRWVAFGEGGWVSVQKGRLRFFALGGSVIRTLNLRGNEVLLAPHGCRAVGVVAYADRQPKTLRAVTFDLYDPEGKQILRLNDPEFATAIVSESGDAFVGVDGAEGLPKSVLHFYDRDGREKRSLDVERFEGGRFSDDGTVFLFETAAAGLQAFTAAGEEMGVIGPADRWAASSDATIILRVSGTRMLFYREGKLDQTLAWDERYGTIRAVALSPDGGHAAVVSATHAAVYDAATGATLWTKEIGNVPWNYRSAAISNGATLVAFGSDYDPGPEAADRHQRSRCEVFDRDAQPVHTEEETPSKWGALFPQVRFDPTANRLLFIDRDRFKLLSFE